MFLSRGDQLKFMERLTFRLESTNMKIDAI